MIQILFDRQDLFENPSVKAAFQGYDFPFVIKEIAALGSEYVELAFIMGYSQGSSEETFSKKEARALKQLLAVLLSCEIAAVRSIVFV